MYFPDGKGNVQVINLTEDGSRGLFGNNNVDVNDHVRYLLFTR